MRRYYLNKKKGIGVVISLILFISIESVSLGQPISEVTLNYIEASSATDQSGNKVSAFVTVLSSDQKPVQGLSILDFRALEDGNEITLESVTHSDESMSLVLAIDTSGSMLAKGESGETSIEAAKDAAIEFISMLGNDDKVALFSFDNDTNFHQDFSNDHEASIEGITGLSARYMAATRLYDTVLEAVKKASEIPKGRRAVVILTDGRDEKGDSTCSIHNLNDIIDAATTKTIRVPIYTIGVGPQVDAKELGRMASLTGGRSMLAASLSELPGFYRLIAEQLKNQYLIEYITHSPSGEHSLVVKVIKDGNIGQDEKRFWSPPLPVLKPSTVSTVSPEANDSVSLDITDTRGRFIIIGAFIFVLLLVGGVFIWKQRQNRKKEKDTVAVTKTMPRIMEPASKAVQPDEKGESFSDIDNEATTMDIQSVMDPIAKLTVIKSHELDLGATFKVLRTTEIGRGTGNNIRIPDKSVSRKHAIINYAGGKFHIRDLKSSYGTRVDNQEVKSEGIVINDGAEIQFGNKTVMKFNILVIGKETENDDKTIIYGQDS